jgi:dolichyl-phosphate beta-glucosyltransferase
MDADLPVPLGYIKRLIDQVRDHCDVAVASRWMQGAKIGVPQPPRRQFFGKIFYGIIHLLVLSDIHDTNCGLKAYRGVAGRVLFGFVRCWRWAFNVEHLWLARDFGYVVKEIPVEWEHRPDSKVRLFRDCLFTVWELFGIKARQFFGIYPRASRPALPS